MPVLTDDLLVKLCAYITDPVTTTDELIPSGEASSFRSNPERLSEFALSRREPQYVPRSKAVRQLERDRRSGKGLSAEVLGIYRALEAAGMQATVRRASRQPAASGFSAAAPTLPEAMPRSATVRTASTGGSCPS